MKAVLTSLLLCPLLALASPDLTTKPGMESACNTLPAKASALKDNADRQAYAICHDLALSRQIIGWATKTLAESSDDLESPAFKQSLRKELTYIRNELKDVRTVLAQLKLKPGEGLLLAPAEWQTDLNGDGEIEVWEKYFFAIPQRGEEEFKFGMPSNELAYYQQQYQLDAVFRIDQSDVLWALSYHQFAEGLIEMLLAYQLNFSGKEDALVELRDPLALLRAHQLIGAGIANSSALRASLLAETDDQEEWIPNPQQKNTVFPLLLTQTSFDFWGRFLNEFALLWAGKTLLVVDDKAGGMLGDIARQCPRGQGFDVAAMFNKPARYPLADNAMLKACKPVDSRRPASGLITLLGQVIESENPNSPEMSFLRYLYWVN